MNQIKSYVIGFVLIVTAAVYFFIGGAEEQPVKDIVAEKQFMQKADQRKRKGYYTETLSDRICGYYDWWDGLKWNTDMYCVGKYGKVKSLPDSLNFWHRRMIDEVDKIANRKGYGGW